MNASTRSARFAAATYALAVCLSGVLPAGLVGQEVAEAAMDIRSVAADLTVPDCTDGVPAAGRRVRLRLDAAPGDVYHVVYLPRNFDVSKRYPLVVEFAGNGGYVNRFGDRSDGVPEGSRLGYGVSGGDDFVWLCLPFVTADGTQVATQWWGSPPDYSPEETVQYAKRAVAEAIATYRVDARAVILCGFSRGAIVCNFIGLHDDEIAKLWCGFVVYSHYDGVRDWHLPGTDAESAKRRLQRLGNRPQFICHEMTEASDGGLSRTRAFLEGIENPSRFTWAETGFRNHSDAWILRPSAARDQLRAWVRAIPSVANALDHLGGKANDPGN